MLSSPTIERIRQLRLHGFQKALEEQQTSGAYEDMSFQDRLGLLLEREMQERENHSLCIRLGRVRFKESACLEDVRPSAARGLDKSTLKELAQCNWIKQKRNIVVTGPSGAGKSYLSQALAHKACLMGYTARYFRSPALLADLDAARAEGRYRKTLNQLGRYDVLIVDDFSLCAMSESEEKDLFELIEERHRDTATIFTSQNPVNLWHGLMPNPAIADAILDRIIHGAIRLELKGDSQRKEVEGNAKLDKNQRT
jgi:DNA replication protein DnaC